MAIIATNLFLVILLGSISLAILQQKLNIRKVARTQALHVAEAGVNYYRWALYHDQNEYCNKETCIGPPDYGPYGPYPYTDSGGENITGYYELYITPPPPNGSTIVKVKSVGWVADYPEITRSIEVMLGISSWTTYATMTNGADQDLAYGTNSEVWGPVHCNYGCVSFDGIANNIVTSSQPGCGSNFGVYTCRDGCDVNWDGNDPPLNLPDPERPNFRGGRDMGSHIQIVSFSDSVGGEYMNMIYDKATSSEGLLFDPANAGAADPDSDPFYWGCESSGTCGAGFRVTFKSNNKFDLRMVSSQGSNYVAQGESSAREYDVPENGVIFVKHSVWVSGQFDNGASGTRATVFAFEDPIDGAGSADIIIHDNMLYSTTTGIDALGLIAQHDVTFSANCSNNVEVDAALLAKTGRRFAPNFVPNKNSATIYGNTASFLKPSMSSGFNNRYYVYDNNLTFGPPPHYPSTGQYTFISWKEE